PRPGPGKRWTLGLPSNQGRISGASGALAPGRAGTLRATIRDPACAAERDRQVPLWCSARDSAPHPPRKAITAPAAGRKGPLRTRGCRRRGAGFLPAAPAASGAFPPQPASRGGSLRPRGARRFRGWRARVAAQRAPAGPGTAGCVAMLQLLVPLLGLALAYFALLDGWYLLRVPCAVLRARLLQPRVRDLLAEQRYAGRVLPSDLDLLLHMNNARYLREADVARAAHLARCGVLGALRTLGARAVLAASCARYRRSLRLLEPFEVRTRLLGWDDRAFYLEARFVSLRDGFLCALLRSRQHVLGTSPERVVQHLCKRRRSPPPPALPEPPGNWALGTAPVLPREVGKGRLRLQAGSRNAWGSRVHAGQGAALRGQEGRGLTFLVEPPELPEDLQHWVAYNEASSRLLRAESGLSERRQGPVTVPGRPRPPGHTLQDGLARLSELR
ncbi:hypothetical protein QTO34_007526, partial [Cnephaeus nilssonii]